MPDSLSHLQKSMRVKVNTLAGVPNPQKPIQILPMCSALKSHPELGLTFNKNNIKAFFQTFFFPTP